MRTRKVFKYCSPESAEDLEKVLRARESELEKPIYQKFRDVLSKYENLKPNSSTLNVKNRFVEISNNQNKFEIEVLKEDLNEFIPWRKGPFIWNGVELEAEWNSHMKWERLEDYLGPVWGRRVLDVGCNNGYYMLRLLEKNPEYVLGIDPTVRFYYQYKLLTKGVYLPNCDFELLGFEHMTFFPKSFDLILFMGILYHHSDPIGQLKLLKYALRKKGRAIIEVQGIDDPKPVSLFPEKRYAKAPGVWFLPSASCLVNMLHRAGFRNIDIISSDIMTEDEQRNTEFCPRPFETLVDFLDPKDKTKTIEGYPAPYRHLVVAQ